jgi:hypothetical protein
VEANRCLKSGNGAVAVVQKQSDTAHSLLASMEELQVVRMEGYLGACREP